MLKIPVFLVLSIVLTGALASVEQSHSDETLSSGKESAEKSLTSWWLPPALSVAFILSMHVWVYGVAHGMWYIASLLTSRIHVKKT